MIKCMMHREFKNHGGIAPIGSLSLMYYEKQLPHQLFAAGGESFYPLLKRESQRRSH